MCLPTLTASALTKRESEAQRKHQDAETPLERRVYFIYLVLARMQVCLIFTVFSLLFFKRTTTKKASAAPPQISLIISRCAWHRVYGLICANDYRCSNKNQVQRRISQHGNMCCKHSEYPELLLDTACHCFECSIFQETLTASLTLPWKEKQTTRHKTGKMCTGILNMGRQLLDLLLTLPSIPD